MPPGFAAQYGTGDLDYVNELGQARAITAVRDEKAKADFTTNAMGCWISSLKPNTDGYVQKAMRYNSLLHTRGKNVDINGVSVKASPGWLLHRVAYVSWYGIEPIYDASHLCGIRKCFNPAHIWDEIRAVNDSRKYCIGTIICPVHGDILVDGCQHTPRCIRPPIPVELIKCCATRAEELQEALLSTDGEGTIDSNATTPRALPQLLVEQTQREAILSGFEALDPSQVPGSEMLALVVGVDDESTASEASEEDPSSEGADGTDVDGRRTRARLEEPVALDNNGAQAPEESDTSVLLTSSQQRQVAEFEEFQRRIDAGNDASSSPSTWFH
jgi:hypothetical protein